MEHALVFDTIHVITNETVWFAPDSLGRQYPLKTTHHETGSHRIIQTDKQFQHRDTIYIQSSTNHETSTTNHEPITLNQKTTTWLPWLIIICMILASLIILTIRIFL